MEDDFVTVTDPEGFTLRLTELDGVYASPFPGIKERVKKLKTFKCRDDDILILAFAKSGTHWTWEIAHMLSRNTTEHIVGEKSEQFLEAQDAQDLEAHKSPRILNTHLRPERIPDDFIRRKCKIIYIQRNPKDVFVSLYNHCKNLEQYYRYSGNFSGFFELALEGKVESGNWFEYAKLCEKFLKAHPDVPVLRLHYEDMKMNLLEHVKKIAEFCNFSVSAKTMAGIAEACTFSNMRKFKVDTVNPDRQSRWKDGRYNMYRKGVSGDWKNWFTVAQNERFEAESRKQLEGSDVCVKWAN
ncbi:sulfotransferase 1C2-like [Liolophura sinensis]|uniref:sulfotransferase 1C2-like n=1 Tax=Liolophura sinensis TaxID=3198878 RepID=UPI003159289A